MKCKKVIHSTNLHPHKIHPPTQNNPQNLIQTKNIPSGSKHYDPLRVQSNKVALHSQSILPADDYDWQWKEKDFITFIPITTRETEQPPSRSQRNSHSRLFLHREHQNTSTTSLNTSQNSCQQGFRVFSAEKNHSLSKSENRSTGKRKGISLTKTLLKRISGMYTDQDFQNDSNKLSTHKLPFEKVQ